MPAYVARVFRVYEGCSRTLDKAYVNVINGFQSLGQVDDLAEWLTAHPESDWLDDQYNEYVLELTQTQFDNYSVNGPWWDHRQNLPRWQHNGEATPETGDTEDLGSYADPEDDQTTFTSDAQLIDDRWIFRVFDDDPVAEPVSANHIGEEDFDETAVTEVTRYMQAFNELDVARTWNMANARTNVAGKLMDFDWGSSHSPALSAGVTSFKVGLSRTGEVTFFSNHQYRFIGPDEGNPEHYKASIYGKVLRASAE